MRHLLYWKPKRSCYARFMFPLVTAFFTCTLAVAQDVTNSKSLAVPALEEETRLALSAAPEHLRAKAGLYVFTAEGFKKIRDSQNGFTCIVNRDHPLNLKPTCYDEEGAATILPKVLFVGKELAKGEPIEKIGEEVAKKFQAGEFVSPRRPGVAYMLSNEIRNFNPRTGRVGSFPPHVMFYAPNLTNADIGSDGSFSPGMPSIAYPGPHAFMVVVLPKAGSPAAFKATRPLAPGSASVNAGTEHTH